MSSDPKKADPTGNVEQKRSESEEQLSLLQTITRQLAAADDLSSALKIVLREVCEKTGWELGQAWVPNKDDSALVCDTDWFRGEGDLKRFELRPRQFSSSQVSGFPAACGSRNNPPGLRTSDRTRTSRERRRPGASDSRRLWVFQFYRATRSSQ